MNIFAVHEDPVESAKQLCDKHICKMILESVQMLCTAHKDGPKTCAPSHMNHPCTRWTRESRGNYDWLVDHTVELCKQYTDRYGKIHAWQEAVNWLDQNRPEFTKAEKTEHPQCMPAHCKIPGDSIGAYRLYYIKEKSYMAKWKKGNSPSWYIVGSPPS